MADTNTIDVQKLSNRLQAATKALDGVDRAGDLVMKIGRIARPTWNIRNGPNPKMAEFMKLSLNDVVLVERSWKAGPKETLNWLYVFAQPSKGDTVVEGWVRSDGVLLDAPEPEATVEYIPRNTNLYRIAYEHYVKGRVKQGEDIEKGDDTRFYVAALAYVNRNYDGMKFPDGWTDNDFKKLGNWAKINIRSGYAIWLPKREVLLPLKGQFVSSGSITYELMQAFLALTRATIKVAQALVGIPAFAAGLFHGVLLSVYDALMDLPELIKLVWNILKSLLSPVQLVKDAKQLLETLWDLPWRQLLGEFAEDFMTKWEAEGTWERYYFQGEVVGYIMCMVALAFISGGVTAAASAAAKASKLARVLAAIMKSSVVKRVLANATVKKIIDKVEDALKNVKEIQEKLALRRAKSDGLLFKGLRLSRGYDKRMGIFDKHLEAMIAAARETNVIAIFRANKEASIPLIREGAHGKPMWAKFKTDKNTGVLTAKEWPEYATAHKYGHYTVSDDGKSMFMMVNGTRKEAPLPNKVFWQVKPGQVIHADGKPFVGDYDLLGVAPVKSPGRNITVVPEDLAYGDWTGPDVERFREAVNRKGRLDESRVLHGAQDGLVGKYAGLTDDTAYAVFPDGRTYVMEGKKAQQDFYDAMGRQTAAGSYHGEETPVGEPDWHLKGNPVRQGGRK